MDGGEPGGTRDERNLKRVLHNASREADMCAGYALDAEATGNERLAGFFREVQGTHARIARRAKGVLVVPDDEHHPAGVRSSSIPAEGDPGDVSPGQDGL